MKQNERFIYIGIVIIPAIIFTFIFYHLLIERAANERNEHLEWVASIHRNQMDQFINETKVSLDILEASVEEEPLNLAKLKKLLEKTAERDPRYGGIYLLDAQANVQSGTNDLLKQYNLRDKPYIKEALATKSAAVANEPETLVNNQPVVAIATPVISDDENVSSILVAHIRLDYMKNIMSLLTPDESISFENVSGIQIFTVNDSSIDKQSKKHLSYRTPLMQVPWFVTVHEKDTLMRTSAPFIVLFTIITFIILHVVFLLVKYSMLKRQTRIDYMQQETQKLELIGTLAASTAHEIRNPLTGIKGLVQLLGEKYDDESDRLYFSVIDKEIGRINQIVSEFLILGKPTAQKPIIVDIRDIILDVNPLIYSEANLHSVEYKMALPETEIPVDVNVDQIKQVILNLTKNAFEAMPDGGQLTVTIIQDDRRCLLTVSDTGRGIKQEEADQLFKPFYTSKKHGTGLGLVVCRRIVESFDGNIWIESDFGSGTRVHISLPIKWPHSAPSS
ncbi:ATP-binding protein [Domibacillus epiphyticus]|uniref:histidine kinase n=1 Tax=Domibacillus epiphyticus TaxID=1714355 RepID=A0A1V2A5F4_9BACI|nr:ATP-binding protein [Domibacillus epiphyticus]OMP66228.1 hypothetical protein BTO28_13480 [Domibacillus epiphyticus]